MYLPALFKSVAGIFSISAIATGAHAIIHPTGFSKSFGLPLKLETTGSMGPRMGNDDAASRMAAKSYVALMGVRQLATGIILLTFAFQGKWEEVATILAIIGIVVAGTDGIYLSRAGDRKLARFHAIPGALIAALAAAFIYFC